jgi:hypothetical protein
MSRVSDRSCSRVRALVAATLALALGVATAGIAAAAQPDASAADPATTERIADGSNAAQPAAESRRRARDGRRNADATVDAAGAAAARTRDATSDASASRDSGSAPPVAAEVSAETTAAATGDEELVCRNMAITGTNVKRRVCGTKEQWAAQRNSRSAAAQEGLRQVRDQTTVLTSPPAFPETSPGSGLR